MKIAYDLTLKRPACVLLAAALGGDIALVHAFNADDWLIEHTPGMRVYEITEAQFQTLIERHRNG